VRIVSYNIRHAQGIGGLISLKRTARIIGAFGADVVVLNEVYRWLPRFDQPSRLAALTSMNMLFQVNDRHGPADYGNVILSKVPPHLYSDIKLPGRGEPRGCMVAELELDGSAVRIAVTHLGLTRAARAEQIEALACELPRDLPLVLAGDTNCTAKELGPLLAFMRTTDAEPRTFPSWAPLIAYDHILFDESWTLNAGGAVRTLASDHLPLWADLRVQHG
jgi:endonuclease/exonuclease/phosphatase family metal-dependent hydrolase